MRANGTASRMAMVLSPYLRYVSEDLGTWYADEEGGAWVEAHEVLRLRLEPVDQIDDERVSERLQSYKRLLTPSSLGRIELLTLRQATEDLRLWPARLDGRTLLVQEVVDFLNRCTEIIGSTQEARSRVRTLLEQLSPHIGPRYQSIFPRWEEEGLLGKEERFASLLRNDPSVPSRPGRLADYYGGSAGS
jgi:hypothetical protein